MSDLDVVLAELDRIADLSVVQDQEGGADTFATGARWTVRMIREAIERGAPAPPVVQGFPYLAVVPPSAP